MLVVSVQLKSYCRFTDRATGACCIRVSNFVPAFGANPFLGAFVDTVWQSNAVTSAARNTRYRMHRPAPGEAALWHGFNDFTLRLGSCGKDNLAVYFPSRDAACDLQHVGISPAHTRSNFFGRVVLRAV
jgi:hypothetical protein